LDTILQENIDQRSTKKSISECVYSALDHYFSTLDGQSPKDLYQMILAEMEIPLLEEVMAFNENNQSKAALMLGVSRGTLRKKLKLYHLDKLDKDQ
jgi:Fis family transcriptional regulator